MPSKCSHINISQPRSRKSSRTGRIRYVFQCLDCGQSIGRIQKQVILNNKQLNPEPFDEKLLANNRSVGKPISYRSFDKETYDRYLSSDKWMSIRTRVIERCGGLCEGCRIFTAVEVHHLTYKNVFNEFLFELVGLCKECHSRWHGAK